MAAVSSGSASWNLQKYARFVDEEAQPNDAWKFYDSSTAQLELLLTPSHHLVICQGQHILENISLWNASSWMKGTSKGDSMLILYKMQERNHKFRVKFSGEKGEDGIETCSGCILRLSRYFPVKRISMQGQEEALPATQSTNGEGDGKDAGDSFSVGKLAEVLTSQGAQGLPAVYRDAAGHIPSDQLSAMLTLCLTDANFPAFVGQVEKELNKLKK